MKIKLAKRQVNKNNFFILRIKPEDRLAIDYLKDKGYNISQLIREKLNEHKQLIADRE